MIDHETFRKFGRIVNAEHRVHTTEDGTEELIIDNPDHDGCPIEIQWREPTNGDPTCITASHHIVDLGAHIGFEAPAQQWTVQQSVDDGNLLTELLVTRASGSKDDRSSQDHQIVVSIYGPPARYDTGITIENGNDNTSLLK